MSTRRMLSGMGIWIWLFVFVFPVAAADPDPRPRILILNSDGGVEKYRLAQNEFKQSLSYPVMALDMAAEKSQRARLRRIRAHDPQLIYCIGAKAYSFATRRLKDHPIVFSSIINWLRLPLSETTYGVSNELHSRMPLMMFRYLFPGIKKIGVLYSERYTAQWFLKARSRAEELGIQLMGTPIQRKGQSLDRLPELFSRAQALWLIPDPLVMPEPSYLYRILETCDQRQWPVFSYHSAFPHIGAVLSVAADDPTIGRQAANIADSVLSGKLGDQERIRFPAGSHITLNLRKVFDYGLEYNQDALSAVNEIIK